MNANINYRIIITFTCSRGSRVIYLIFTLALAYQQRGSIAGSVGLLAVRYKRHDIVAY